MTQEDIEAYSLSPLQNQLVGDLGNNPPHAAFAILLSGAPTSQSIHEGVAALVEDHEILATSFPIIQGMSIPLQQIGDDEAHWGTAVDLDTTSLNDALSQEPPAKVPLYCRMAGHGGNNTHLLVYLQGLAADNDTPDIFCRLLAETLAQREPQSECMQYIDYSQWQEELLGETREEVSDATAPKSWESLPLQGRTETHDFQFGRVVIPMNSSQLNLLKEHDNQRPFLLHCWQVFLCRHLSREQITVTVDLPGRIYDELEYTLGPVDPLITLEFKRDSDLTSTSKALEAEIETQNRHFRGVSAPANLSRYGYLYRTHRAYEANNIQLKIAAQYVPRAPFDLQLEAFISDSQIHLTLNYNTQAFSQDKVSYLAQGFGTLLQGAIQSPDASLSRLPLIGDQEKAYLLNLLDNPDSEGPPMDTICARFQACATQYPEKPAVFYEGTILTYAQLDSKANQIAHYLLERGIGLETRVAFCLERSALPLALILGIHKVGAAYVPLQETEPEKRLADMITDSGATLVFYDPDRHPGLAALLPQDIERVRPSWDIFSTYSNQAVPLLAGPHNLAYVIYTSGSTGKPKGVQIAHHSPLNLWQGLAALVYQDLPQTGLKIGLNAPFSFDASMQQIVALTQGHCLYVIPQETRFDGLAFVAYLQEHNLDALDCTPTHLTALLGAGLATCDAVPSRVLVAGGAIGPELWDTLEGISGSRFFDIYGPTECTIDATGTLIDQPGVVPSIGPPLANYRVVLLDQHGSLVPAGATGELCIGGAGLARGYLQRFALTAETFIPDAFSGKPGERLYRTGDLAHLDLQGRLIFIGRKDHQVKIRGFRVELGEIEETLAACEGINAASVQVYPHGQDGKDLRLVAFYVLIEEGASDEHRIRKYLEERLPEHMVPPHFVKLDTMPLKPSGKVDTKALPQPDFHHVAEKDDFDTTHLPMEGLIAALWEEVLDIDAAGMDNDFFEMGGHSLLATQLVSRVRDSLDVPYTLQDLFVGTTVRQTAERVRQLQNEERGIQLPPLKTRDLSQRPPLSFAQQRLWTIQTMDTQSTVYNVPMTIRMKGELNISALEASFKALVTRHECLRITFAVNDDGTPYQAIASNYDLPINQEDLSHLEGQAQDTAVAERRQAFDQHVFDLEKGPLVIAGLLKISSDDHILMVNMHHIITDAWSSGILVRELSQLYESKHQGEPDNLPKLPLTYSDYAVWQRSWLRDEVLERELDYWKTALQGAPHETVLPGARPRSERLSEPAGRYIFNVPASVMSGIHDQARSSGSTLFMVLLAALKSLTWYHTNEEDITIGTDVANRNYLDIEPVIGFFINQLTIRSKPREERTFTALLEEVRSVTLAAYQHQDVPFDKVVEAVNPPRIAGVFPLFQMKLVLQNTPVSLLTMDQITLEVMPPTDRSAQTDFLMDVWEEDGSLGGMVTFAPGIYNTTTIKRLMRQWVSLLELVSKTPDISLKQLRKALDDAEEQHRQDHLNAHRKKKGAFKKFKR